MRRPDDVVLAQRNVCANSAWSIWPIMTPKGMRAVICENQLVANDNIECWKYSHTACELRAAIHAEDRVKARFCSAVQALGEKIVASGNGGKYTINNIFNGDIWPFFYRLPAVPWRWHSPCETPDERLPGRADDNQERTYELIENARRA